MTPESPVLCPWCGVTAPLVRVHGHAQCAACGVNSEPCCQGAETCPVTLDDDDPRDAPSSSTDGPRPPCKQGT